MDLVLGGGGIDRGSHPLSRGVLDIGVRESHKSEKNQITALAVGRNAVTQSGTSSGDPVLENAGCAVKDKRMYWCLIK
jgi:hypothetical protein